MVRKVREFKCPGKLTLAVLCVFALATLGAALNVVITKSEQGVWLQQFEITASGTYKHDGRAPSNGDIYTDVEYGPGVIQDSFSLVNGECLTHDVSLWPRTDWFLELNISRYVSGTGSACVGSPQVTSCCPSGGGGSEEQ
jgi:hypothetical protein